MKTVPELAREYGVTPQAIHKRIRRLSTKLTTGSTVVDNHVIRVSPQGERIICDGLKPVNNQVDNHNNQVDNQSCQPSQPVSAAAPVDLVDFLAEQVRVKDDQIAELLAQNAGLVKALGEFQQLQKSEQILRALPAAVIENEADTSNLAARDERDAAINAANPVPKNKKSFFSKFFKGS